MCVWSKLTCFVVIFFLISRKRYSIREVLKRIFFRNPGIAKMLTVERDVKLYNKQKKYELCKGRQEGGGGRDVIVGKFAVSIPWTKQWAISQYLSLKLISTFQLHIFNSKHYKPCKFSERTKIFTLLRVKSKNLHFRINWKPFPVTSSGSCTPTYILFINVITKPRKSTYENKARYRVRTWNIGDMISRYTMTSLGGGGGGGQLIGRGRLYG